MSDVPIALSKRRSSGSCAGTAPRGTPRHSHRGLEAHHRSKALGDEERQAVLIFAMSAAS